MKALSKVLSGMMILLLAAGPVFALESAGTVQPLVYDKSESGGTKPIAMIKGRLWKTSLNLERVKPYGIEVELAPVAGVGTKPGAFPDRGHAYRFGVGTATPSKPGRR